MRSVTFALAGLLLLGARASEAQTRNDVRQLVAAWAASLNSGKAAEAADRFFTADYVWHMPGEDVRGREAVKQRLAQLLQNCPAFRATPVQIVVEGDIVAVRWSARCMPAQPDSIATISMDRVRKGQFVEGWEAIAEKGWLPASK